MAACLLHDWVHKQKCTNHFFLLCSTASGAYMISLTHAEITNGNLANGVKGSGE